MWHSLAPVLKVLKITLYYFTEYRSHVISILICIWEVLSLNLSLHICYPNGFPCRYWDSAAASYHVLSNSLFTGQLILQLFSLFCYLITLSVLRLYSVNAMSTNEFGGVCGMISVKGDLSTWRKPSTLPLCLPKFLHDLTWDWTWSAAVGKPATNPLNHGTAYSAYHLMLHKFVSLKGSLNKSEIKSNLCHFSVSMFPLWDMPWVIGLLFQFLFREMALVDGHQLMIFKFQLIVFNFNLYPVPHLPYKQADIACV